MTSYKLPALLCAMGIALTARAQAADMSQLPPPAPVLVQEFFSAWYLRLDGGYRVGNVSNGNAFAAAFADSTVHDAATIGGGFGLKWNWFRTDITVDYGSQPKFEGFFVPGAAAVTARLTNVTWLWNAYLDLGSWAGFTPYVGAGVGASYLRPTGLQFSPVIAFNEDQKASMDFSWAVMAGLSYSISPGLMIDASYRYLDIGSPRTRLVLPAGGEINYGEWTANEFRLGLRYLIP
jgi:opacity protein-like surface antigen